MSSITTTRNNTIVQDPPIARFLFSDTRMAVVWVVVRVLVGWVWLTSGWGKLGQEGWMQGGAALRAFWERAATVPETGRPPIAFDWYRSFIQGLLDAQAYTWFAPVIAVSQVLVGIALIVGAFVGIAAFFGVVMNWNFIMAGTASTNALLLVAGLLLIMAWKIAGWYGADRWLLRWLGTPWGRRTDGGSPGS